MHRFGLVRMGLVLVALLLTSRASAGTLFTDVGTRPSRFGDGFSLGSRFTVVVPSLEVIALGLHFNNSDAPLQSHEIALWDVTAGNTEVADVTLQAGGAGTTSLNSYLFVSLSAPVALNDGDQYVLAAFYPQGNNAAVNDQINNCCTTGAGPSTDPDFGGFSAAFSKTGSSTSLGVLSEPNSFLSATDYAGVNLEYQSMPEPGSLSMLGLAVLALGPLLRRKVSG